MLGLIRTLAEVAIGGKIIVDTTLAVYKHCKEDKKRKDEAKILGDAKKTRAKQEG